MKLEYGSKSQEYDGTGAVSSTKVTLVNSAGANVPVFLPADKIGLSNTELFDLALDVIYQENFPQRAENERFSKVDQELQKTKRQRLKLSKQSQKQKKILILFQLLQRY